jgi:hypothetical protein
MKYDALEERERKRKGALLFANVPRHKAIHASGCEEGGLPEGYWKFPIEKLSSESE